MPPRPSLQASSRVSAVPGPLDDVWAVVASGEVAPQWYLDAAPFVVRGLLDRAVGGAGRRHEPPGTPLLATGDRAGFWRVTAAGHTGRVRRLRLVADVRAPGLVTLETRAEPDGDAVRIAQRVRFQPDGLLGATYLLLDLPAREAVVALAHRRLLADLARD